MSDAGAPAAHKPIDLGNGRVCASFGADASWLSIGTPHPAHGFIELNALPPFDEAQRGDPDATRRYRALMVLDRHAFLRVELGGSPLVGLSVDPADPWRPRWSGTVDGVVVSVDAVVGEGAALRQRWQLAAEPGVALPTVVVHLRGALDRPALAEITELDPPGATGATTELTVRGRSARVRAAALRAVASLEVVGADGTWTRAGADAAFRVVADPERALIFELVASLQAGPVPPAHVPAPAMPVRQPDDDTDARRIVGRAHSYVRGCTALRTAPDERTILTDHRLLQLSWTRDAYYQALLLLAIDGPGDRDVVADHLRWLWRRNERPDGRWVRSHHANGRRKDLAFQADQQLYPILELADAWRFTGTLPDGVAWTDAVGVAWEAALHEVDPDVELIATAENAADDPAEAPFIGASQILLWYTAVRLGELCRAGVVDLPEGDVTDVADRTRAAFARHLVHGGRWAYATDGHGRRFDYHDANDLPTALAPAWGFCAADDPAWRATMDFAFSEVNSGYWPGPLAGLGSAHTEGAWALGDVQAWLVATLAGDAPAAATVLARLRTVAFDDGMLPEAYQTRDDGIVRLRHWFAWPGAALAALWMLNRRGLLVPDSGPAAGHVR